MPLFPFKRQALDPNAQAYRFLISLGFSVDTEVVGMRFSVVHVASGLLPASFE
jgi:hypothetical protein